MSSGDMHFSLCESPPKNGSGPSHSAVRRLLVVKAHAAKAGRFLNENPSSAASLGQATSQLAQCVFA